jgi:O-antigen ligase/tetratricopeptide (TPR) repeat protein
MPARAASANQASSPQESIIASQPHSWLTTDKAINSLNSAIQATLIVTVGVTPLLFSQRATELFEFPKMILLYLAAVVILALLCSKWAIQRHLAIIKNPLLLLIGLFLAWMTISALAGFNLYTSIAGYYTRFNGGITSYLAYAIVAYACLDQFHLAGAKWPPLLSKLLCSWFTAACLVAIWAILEHFGHDPSCVILRGTFTANCWVEDVQARVFSTFGQPNWLATYLVSAIPVGLALLLNQSRRHYQVLISLGLLVLYAAFWYTYSRSGWFGLIGALLAIGFFVPWTSLWPRWRWLAGIVLGCLFITVSSFNTAALRAETSLSGHGADSSTGSIRLIVWQGAWQIISHHPILGTGPGTFAYSFLPYRPTAMNNTTEWNFLYNEAHNQVLNTAATTGIPGLLAWLSLFVMPLLYLWPHHPLKTVKNRLNRIMHRPPPPKSWTWPFSIPASALPPSYNTSAWRTASAALFAGIIGVFISQLFGFAVVMTNLLLFISLAIILAPFSSRIEFKLTSKYLAVTAGLSLLIVISAGYIILRYASAELLIKQADNLATYSPAAAIATYQKAVQQNPWEPNYRVKLAGAYINTGRLNPEPGSNLLQADRQLQAAHSLNPRDLIIAKSLTYFYSNMSSLNAQYQSPALQAAQAALALAPTDADACQTLADLQFKLGHSDEALALYNRLIAIRPLSAESYIHRAQYFQQYGPTTSMQRDIQTALRLDPNNTSAKQMADQIK